MSRPRKRAFGPGALETVETAVHLLRTAPIGTLATYGVGALPFALGLLFFWADMSRSPFAPQHVAEAALGMGMLFLWLKFWQAVFALRLRAHLSGADPAPLTRARLARILYTQTALQPTALFLLPLALVPALPFPWLFACYQNLTAKADADDATLRATFTRSWRLALLWPAQNHVLLAVVSLFALFVLLGIAAAGMALPELVKMLFGVETVFSRGGMAMLNSTFLTAVLTMTWLCLDPIIKAIYVLRVFQGESLRSGEDLRVALKPFAPAAARVAACLTGWLLLAQAPLAAAPPAPLPHTAPPGTIQPQQLDRAIDDVLQHRKYTWRLPRDQVLQTPEAEPGVMRKFFQRVGKMFRDAAKAVGTWLGKVLRAIFGRLMPAPGTPGEGWTITKQMLLYGLLAVVVSALAVLLIRFWRKRHQGPDTVATQAVPPAPDLADENVAADQLPEDGWTTLARDLLARGEFRLALRAFYLASLAHLAERHLVSLARFKSNRDYLRELERRAHAFPQLPSAFGENVAAFDRVWYGRHEATSELVAQFAANVERIKTGGDTSA